MSQRLEFVIEDERWSALDQLEPLCDAMIAEASEKIDDFRSGAAVVLLTDNQAVRELNTNFRGKDKPTNVLSFPAPDSEDYPGDIALAYEFCADEADRGGKSLLFHAVHLILHGVLHLNGFDHQQEDEADAMEAMEIALLASQGISNPYLINEDP